MKFGKKERDDKGVPLYLLLAPVMHRGGQNRCRTKWRRSGLCRSRFGEGSGGIGGAAGVGGVVSLGDDVLDCIGRVSANSRGCGACGTRRRIGSDGGVHIFTHNMGNMLIVRRWRIIGEFFFSKKKEWVREIGNSWSCSRRQPSLAPASTQFLIFSLIISCRSWSTDESCRRKGKVYGFDLIYIRILKTSQTYVDFGKNARFIVLQVP